MRKSNVTCRPIVLVAAMVAVTISASAVERTGSGRRGAGGRGRSATSGWQSIGLSGGGSMFTPAIAPSDPKVMMVNCDMSAAYITTDGGRNWRMIHKRELTSNTRCRPAFHPTDPRIVYAASGWYGGLKVSRDGGVTWQEIGNLPKGLEGEIAIDPGNPNLMLAGASGAVWMSASAGRTWTKCTGPRGKVVGFHFDQTTTPARRAMFAATEEGIWLSVVLGRTWTERTSGLPWRGIRSFSGGSDSRRRKIVLYCAIPSKSRGGRFEGGVYVSADRGATWVSAMGAGINKETKAFDRWAHGPVAQYHHVLTSDTRPYTVYAFNSNTGIPPPHHTAVYRSDDAGKRWRATFYPDPRFGGFNLEHNWQTSVIGQAYQEIPYGVAICRSHPDTVVQLDGGRCYITTDGGRTWRNGHAIPAGKAARSTDPGWIPNGLVVTSTWHYYVDPFQRARHYIAYTDIGFARSFDAGRTWRWWPLKGRAPWRNTCYELAFDPRMPGKIWGAFSNVHDIPNGNIIMGRHNSKGPGGVCVSTDFADTWKVCGAGLPVAPATSVVLDPKSRPGARTLYAGVFGHGVYRSTDDGNFWTKKSRGLGAPSNMRVARVQLHSDGTLFALVTAMRKGEFRPEGVGLYRSRDKAESWELVNRSRPLLWPKDFAVDPQRSSVIYIGAADAGGRKEGGLWRTTDGGARWRLVARKGREHFGAYFHPKRRGWVYMTLCEGPPGAGLWLSRDGGATWAPFEALPFGNVQRVEFDPGDETVIYVTTFGGSVWRGPAAPLPGHR